MKITFEYDARLHLAFYTEARARTDMLNSNRYARFYSILPMGLRVGLANHRTEDQHYESTYRVDRFVSGLACDVTLATIQQHWKLPSDCFMAWSETTKILYIDLPMHIGNKSLVWFCIDQWPMLMKQHNLNSYINRDPNLEVILNV